MRKFSFVTGLAALATVGAAFSSFITGDFWFYESEEQEDIAFGITVGGGDVFNIGGGITVCAQPTEGISLGFVAEQVRYAIDPETGEKTDVMVIDQIEDCDDVAAYFSPNVPGSLAGSSAHHFGIRVSPKVFFAEGYEELETAFYGGTLEYSIPMFSVQISVDEEEFRLPHGYGLSLFPIYSASFVPLNTGLDCLNAENEYFAALFPFFGNDVRSWGVPLLSSYVREAGFFTDEDGTIYHCDYSTDGEFVQGNSASMIYARLDTCWEALNHGPNWTERVDTNSIIFDKPEDFEDFVEIANNTLLVPEIFTDSMMWTAIVELVP